MNPKKVFRTTCIYQALQEDGGLSDGSRGLHWKRGDYTVSFESHAEFSAEELEAISLWVKNDAYNYNIKGHPENEDSCFPKGIME